MKKTFAYALLVLTALYSCEEGKQEEPVLPRRGLPMKSI